MTQVLVAARDLEIGDRIENGDMEWRAFPAEAVNGAWIVEGAASVPTPARAGEEGEEDKEDEESAEDGTATAEVQRAAERLTGGGISSGLDESLRLIELLSGTEAAQGVQQTTQYYPDPPVVSLIPNTITSPMPPWPPTG